mgnify:CR=1 FL=1
MNKFAFDKDRSIVIDECIGRGASCISYKCTVKFSDNKTSIGVLKEFVPYKLKVELLKEDGRYRYLPSQKKLFIDMLTNYVQNIDRIDELLDKISKKDSTISWYYDSSTINDSSKNKIFELDEENNKYRAIRLLPYESTDASTTIHKFNIYGRIDALIKLCSVVDKFHLNNLIIADLKPKNFLYATDGTTSRIKIIDFDSALLINDEDAVIENQSVSGSPFYSSPEIRNNDIQIFDMYAKRADVYSIGAILLNFVTIKIFDEISNNYGWFKDVKYPLNDLSEQLNDSVFSKLQEEEKDESITLGFWKKFVQIVLKATSSPESRYENMLEIKKELISLQEIYLNKGVHPEVMLNKALDMAENIMPKDIDENLFTNIKEVKDEN